MMRIIAALVCSIAAAAPLARAQDAPPGGPDGRYSFREVSEGLLRLDSRTGQVSMCSRRAAGWGCQVLADERTAYEEEIARLERVNAALQKELASSRQSLDQRAVPRGRELNLPSDADIDRMMSFLERIWRRLVGVVQNMQRETEPRQVP
jgi:hypothetical protein